jgi:uncharacterized protein
MIDVVLDVNVLISAFLAELGIPRRLIQQWRAERFSVVISEGMLAELEEKLHLPRIARRHHVTEDGIAAFKDLLLSQAKWVGVRPEEIAPVTGDPEDDYVLATARKHRVPYLVTGDKLLLQLRQYEGVAVVSPREFQEILNKSSAS